MIKFKTAYCAQVFTSASPEGRHYKKVEVATLDEAQTAAKDAQVRGFAAVVWSSGGPMGTYIPGAEKVRADHE